MAFTINRKSGSSNLNMVEAGHYINQIRQFDCLDREEEKAFFDRIGVAEKAFIEALASDYEIYKTFTIKALAVVGRYYDRIDEVLDMIKDPENFKAKVYDTCSADGLIRVFQKSVYNEIVKKRSSLDRDYITAIVSARSKLDRLRNQFAEANLRLVLVVSKKYAAVCRSQKLMDLVQEGNIGLMKAIDKFDPKIGTKFSTYAVWWIRQSMVRVLAENNRSIHMPAHMNEHLVKIRRFEQEFSGVHGRNPTVEEISEGLSISKVKVHRYKEYGLDNNELSLDNHLYQDQDTTLGDVLDSGVPSPEALVLMNQGQRHVRDAINMLEDDKLKGIIIRRFWDDDTLQEIGDDYSLSRERIRQLQASTLGRISANLGIVEDPNSARSRINKAKVDRSDKKGTRGVGPGPSKRSYNSSQT